MVSVLMPCRNPGPFLDEAIRSALEQPQLKQLLIADGGSTPDVLKTLQRWQQQDSRVQWLSEPDQGPADALNKALALATSDWIGWLNADDLYQPRCLERALSALTSNPQWQMVYGHGQHVDEEGRFLELYPSQPPALGLSGFQQGCFICQPTVVISHQLLKRVGGFDPRWRYAFDFDLWLRIFQKSPDAIGFVEHLQASTRLHAGTITTSQQWRINLECAQLLKRSTGKAAPHWLETAARARIEAEPKATLLSDASLIKPLKLETTMERHVLDACANLRSQQQFARGQQKINSRLPQVLQSLLSSRSDLMALRFHRPEKERLFCNWLLAHGTREYPDLFAVQKEKPELHHWLNQRGRRQKLRRVHQAIWDQHPEHQQRWNRKTNVRSYEQWLEQHWKAKQLPLQWMYPVNQGSKRQRFKQWLLSMLPKAKPAYHGQPGVNLIGYASYALGIGEDLRTTYTALRTADVPVAVIDFAPPDNFSNRRDFSLQAETQNKAPFATTLVCLSPEEMLRYVLTNLGSKTLEGRYVIGYWPWELPRWPKSWMPAVQHVDEVWVSTHHIANALQPHTKKPVRVMPLCVESPGLAIEPLTDDQRRDARKHFNLNPTATLFCFSFDLNSWIERKNPWACVHAFQQAFLPALAGGTRSDVGLIIKTHPPNEANRNWDQLKRLCQLDPRIQLIENTLSRSDLLDLYGCCDAFLSLHRAEGFGRGLAEALQLGLHVVSTDWSGNTDFCQGPLAHPVPAKQIPVPPGAYPHWPDQHWAEPDLQVAAQYLQMIADKPMNLKSIELSDSYRQQFSAHVCGANYRKILESLGLVNVKQETVDAMRAPSAHPPR